MISFIIVGLVFFGLFALPKLLKKRNEIKSFPNQWREVLKEYVPFYNRLDAIGKATFENDVLNFLNNHKITGVDTEVDDVSRVLIGASAIIPIFHFDNWNYPNLHEVLLFETEVENRQTYDGSENFEVQGMVTNDSFGNGVLMLAKDDLINGFSQKSSKSNVGIHEFVHMIDKADGDVDGMPEILINQKLLNAWSSSIYKEIERIRKSYTKDINPYGATSPAEFLAVISEYFFKKPAQLKRKHPELYELLDEIFGEKD